MEDTTRPHSDGAQFLDTAYAVLRNRRRRHVVSLLTDRESRISLTELAAGVAARERRADAGEIPAAKIDDAAVTLHHNHLPKLADAGVVAYDAEAKAVTPTNVGELAPLLPENGTDGI